MTVSKHDVDEILVVTVTGSMSRQGGMGRLEAMVTAAIQAEGKKILLDLEPNDWDSYGFDALDKTLKRIGKHQQKVVCRMADDGPIKDARWAMVYLQAECYDSLDQAVAVLKEDC